MPAKLDSESRNRVVGPSIGPYRILDRLGAGGMGEVYLAEDPRLRRQVAIKAVARKRLDEPDARRRLLREARAAANLSHPNIAAIYDILESEGQAHIVMEYVRGETLASVLKRGPLAPSRAIEIGLQLADALAAAHAQDIVHRDLKPANVVLTPEAKAKVLDFGLAKRPLSADSESLPDSDITPGHQVVGTPQYMSPEQLKGGSVDARSDLYSFGVVLFEMLTARRPYDGRDLEVLLTAILSEPPPSARAINPGVPADLDAIARRAMARDPEARYPSAAALRSDLAAAALGQSGVSTFSASALLRSGPLASPARKRLALAALSLLIVLAGMRWLPQWTDLAQATHAVPADAERWYEQGASALREGSYLTAAKRLEQAIALHDPYPVAHARLAEARAELDDDRAKDSLLYVQKLVPDLSRLPKEDALYLEGIRAMVTRRFAEAVRAYTELAELFPSESHVQFGLGRAHEANDAPTKAIGCYERAAQLDSTSPAPHLRLGELRGQQQQLDAALASFKQAEDLYEAASNVEGVTEVACRRGALYNSLDRSREARVELERALKVAAETHNTNQRVRALLQLSGVAATEGRTDEAEKHASEAMTLARGMDSLTANGLIDLGNVFFRRGELERAGRYFEEALSAARRLKALRTEARALLSLGSLRISQGQVDHALPFLKQALAFYEQRAYPKTTSQAYMLLGQAHDLRGAFGAAVEAFEEQLRAAWQAGDDALVAQSQLFLGLALLRWERYPQALQSLDQSLTIYQRLDHADTIHCQASKADALLRLGRTQEAASIVRELAAEVSVQKEVPEVFRRRVRLLSARLATQQQRFAEAIAALRTISVGEGDVAMDAESATELALASIRLGDETAAAKAATTALSNARRSQDPVLEVGALLARAEVLSQERSNAATGLDSALQALSQAERYKLRVSAWRASTLAACAAERAGDTLAARSHRSQADGILTQLQSEWGEVAVRSLVDGSGALYRLGVPITAAVGTTH